MISVGPNGCQYRVSMWLNSDIIMNRNMIKLTHIYIIVYLFLVSKLDRFWLYIDKNLLCYHLMQEISLSMKNVGRHSYAWYLNFVFIARPLFKGRMLTKDLKAKVIKICNFIIIETSSVSIATKQRSLLFTIT